MRAIEAALLIGVFFLLRTAIKRVPPRYFVLVEALIFLRLLLPSFPLLPLNVWGSIELNENAKMIFSTHLFEKISPFVAATLLLWGFLSYLLLLRKRSYQSGKNNLYYHDGKEAFVVVFLDRPSFCPLKRIRERTSPSP